MRSSAVVLMVGSWWLTVGAIAERTAPIPSALQTVGRVELPNGLRVIVGQRTRVTGFSEVLLVARAGGGVPRSEQDQTARIAAAILTAGTVPPDPTPIRLRLARLGVSMDVTVGRDVAVFRMATPTRNTSPVLSLLSDTLGRRSLPDDLWEQTRTAVREADRQAADGWTAATSELTSMIWTFERPSTERSLSTASQHARDIAALAAFRHSGYSPRNLVLSVWGDRPVQEIIEAARESFGPLVAVTPTPRAAIPDPVLRDRGGIACLEHGGASSAALLVGAGARVDSDEAFYALQIAVHILGASYNSRLQRRLRDDAQVVYTVEASAVPVGHRGMTLRIACQTDQITSTRRIIREELSRLTRSPVAVEELDFARALLRSRLALDAASVRDQFYRQALALLAGPQFVREPAGAQALLSAFTPATLLSALRRSLRADLTSTVVLSSHPEALCEATSGNGSR